MLAETVKYCWGSIEVGSVVTLVTELDAMAGKTLGCYSSCLGEGASTQNHKRLLSFSKYRVFLLDKYLETA